MLRDVFASQRSAILDWWYQSLLETYPAHTARFLRREQNQFANPAGHILRAGLEAVLDEMLGDADWSRLEALLEDMIKLRALQDFTPSQAVSFVFMSKPAVRSLADANGAPVLDASVARELEATVDQLAMAAFDVYMKCRERVYEVRYNQLKKMNYTLLERANRMYGAPREQDDETGAADEASASQKDTGGET